MYKVIDNFIPEGEQDILQKLLMSLSYTMSKGTVDGEYRKKLPFVKTLKKETSIIQFESRIIDESVLMRSVDEDLFRDIWNIFVKNNIESVVKSINYRNDYIINRIKSNYLTRKSGFRHVHHTPHVDLYNMPEENQGVSCNYYINDSDGPTVLYNEKYKDNPSKLTVYKKIPFKKGRLLAFNSERYHTSSSPKNHDSRHILNLVFYPKQFTNEC